MKRLALFLMLLVAVLSCQRRELTYSYNPTVPLVIVPNWVYLSERPEVASVYCYPESGDSPVIKYTSDIDSIVVNVPEGVYRILVFNEMPDDFYTITFSGMNSYETAEVYASTTASSWYASRAEDYLVYEPAELVASTYHTVTVTSDEIDEVLGLRSLDETVEIPPHDVLYLTPKPVVKNTRVTVKAQGIDNLYSIRGALYGMATGYKFADQISHSAYATHTMESTTWSKSTYDYDVTQGELTTSFRSFGMPSTTTITRSTTTETKSGVDDDWEGVLYLEALLVDLDMDNIKYYEFDINNNTTVYDTDDSKADYVEPDTDVDVDIDIDVDIAVEVELEFPVTEPSGGSSGGFSAEVEDWGDEEKVTIPMI